MPDEQNLEEHLISQEAKKRVSNQLDQVEKIDIDVQTNLLKIVQGQADAVSFVGQGLVIKKDIRVQEIQLQTTGIAINPLGALFGQIELDEPVNSIARVTLTETDINCALASNFTQKLIQNFELKVDDKIISFQPQDLQVFLPGDRKIGVRGRVILKETENDQVLGFTATLHTSTTLQTIKLASFTCTEGDGVSIELIMSLMRKAKELLSLPYFEWEDMIIRIQNIEVQKEHFILVMEVDMRKISPFVTELIDL